MSLLGTLAKVAIGVAVAKGVCAIGIDRKNVNHMHARLGATTLYV